ncbi:hypothetical protein F2Q69_00014261 [Brassica cretica]|uniref:Uncharacterized protein n=1 Tax=Brassica cretica TaxID=69181 RepID=A0A8S9QZB3_BRACR|nr:hypothetical protein F2Q69_00014261 [Brassica cretica]
MRKRRDEGVDGGDLRIQMAADSVGGRHLGRAERSRRRREFLKVLKVQLSSALIFLVY